MLLQLMKSYRISIMKYQCIINQVKQYMKHKTLPVHMQHKLLNYYEYKFQKRYFREQGITENLSGKHFQQNEILLIISFHLLPYTMPSEMAQQKQYAFFAISLSINYIIKVLFYLNDYSFC